MTDMQPRAESVAEKAEFYSPSLGLTRHFCLLKQVDEKTNPQAIDFHSSPTEHAHLLLDVQSTCILFIGPLQKLVMHVWSKSLVNQT